MGLSASTIKHLSQDALANVTDDPSSEVPRLKYLRHTNHEAVIAGEEPPEREGVYYTIPRDRWEYIETRHAAAENLRQLFSDPLIQTGVKTIVNGQRRQLVPYVAYTEVERVDGTRATPSVPFETFQEHVPDQTDGSVGEARNRIQRTDMPVHIERGTIKEEAYFNCKFRPAPGGCAIQGGATLCTPAYSYAAGDYGWVTAAHVIDHSSGTNVNQPNWYTFDSKIGESYNYTQPGSGDAAFIEADYAPDTAWGIAGTGCGYDYSIYGIVGFDHIKDMQQNGEDMYKQGRTTGRVTGSIAKVSDGDPVKVQLYADSDGGDSGGPYFDLDSGEAYIAAIHRGSWDVKTVGHGIEWAENALNFNV